jgi:hypothetical protein
MNKSLIVFVFNLLAFFVIYLPFRFFILPLLLGSVWQIMLMSLLISVILSPKFSLFPKTKNQQLLMKLPFIKRPYLFNFFKL